MGISNTFATIPGIVSPALTGVIVSDQVSFIYLSYIFSFFYLLSLSEPKGFLSVTLLLTV